MEIGTVENQTLVSQVYEKAMGMVNAEQKISAEQNYVYQIELLSQEVNSGASFEQYFRWVSSKEVNEILNYIQQLKLPEVSTIVEEAIKIAFPNGVPNDEDDYEDATEWSEDQEEKLEFLFQKFENYNGIITNKLGEFIIENNLSGSK